MSGAGKALSAQSASINNTNINKMSALSHSSRDAAASTPAKKGVVALASTPPLSAEKFRRDEGDDENSQEPLNVLPRSPITISASAALPATIDAVTTPLRDQVRRALGETERLRVEAERLASKLISRTQAHELVSRASKKEKEGREGFARSCNAVSTSAS